MLKSGQFHRLMSVCALLIVMHVPAQANPPAFDLADYRGRVVVLDFWASWCKPCRQSIPWLNEMHSRYAAKGLVVLGVNVDAERSEADRFLIATPIHFAVLFDSQGDLARKFALQGMPSSYVFDRDGKLVATHVGFQDAKKKVREADLRNLLEKESR